MVLLYSHKKTDMYKLLIIAICSVFFSCNNTKEKKTNSDKAVNIEVKEFEINYIGDYNIVSTGVISFNYISKNKTKPDSVSWNIGGKRGMCYNITDNTFSIEYNNVPVGSQTILYTIHYKEKNTQTGRKLVKILSDTKPENYTYKVIKDFPHNTKSYTQGLEFDGAILYEGTGLYGESILAKLNIKKNETIQLINLPSDKFGEGITILNNKVYQLTWKAFTGYVYNKHTLQKTDEFTYSTEGWGLCNDGKRLIMSDGTEKVYFIDTTYLQVTGSIQVYDNEGMISSINELEYIDGLVYANIYGSDNIIAFDPVTGKVIKNINLQGILKTQDKISRVDVLNGIAYDHINNRIIVTGKWWPKLFEIELIKQ